jgi:hypothetical protein
MKNFVCVVFKNIFVKNVFFLLSFCFFMTISCSEKKRELATVIMAHKTFNIFDPQTMVKGGVEWTEFVPRDLLITPNKGGFFYTVPREVYYVHFGTFLPSKPLRLHSHTCTKYAPMIAAAQDDNILWVVSACNCKRTGSDDRVAEYIISRSILVASPDGKSHGCAFSETTYKRQDFPRSIQAIGLSNTGKILAIASQNTVHIINLETQESRESFFSPRVENVLIVDIAMRDNQSHLAAVQSQGLVNIKQISEPKNDMEVSSLKSFSTNEIGIEKIHFFGSGNLLFVTDEGFAKIIEMPHWLECDQGSVTTRIFSYYSMYNKVAVDQGHEFATVHWIDDTRFSKNGLCKIKIHREHGVVTEKFILKTESSDKKYSYIGPQGQEVRDVNRWLNIALRGNCVVGLSTDGTIQWWRLPDKPVTPSESYVMGTPDRFLLRRRSTSESSIPMDIKRDGAHQKKRTSGEVDKAKRRSLVHVIRAGAGMGEKSREQSPARHHLTKKKEEETSIQSPHGSPRQRKDSHSLPSIFSIDDRFDESQKSMLELDYSEYEKLEPRNSGKDGLKKK